VNTEQAVQAAHTNTSIDHSNTKFRLNTQTGSDEDDTSFLSFKAKYQSKSKLTKKASSKQATEASSALQDTQLLDATQCITPTQPCTPLQDRMPTEHHHSDKQHSEISQTTIMSTQQLADPYLTDKKQDMIKGRKLPKKMDQRGQADNTLFKSMGFVLHHFQKPVQHSVSLDHTTNMSSYQGRQIRIHDKQTLISTDLDTVTHDYDRASLIRIIKDHGGYVFEDLSEAYPPGERGPLVKDPNVSGRSRRVHMLKMLFLCIKVESTPEYMLALAYGVPIISYRWVLDSIQAVSLISQFKS
jgi:hypothetical protein